jgi:hypothetical protein
LDMDRIALIGRTASRAGNWLLHNHISPSD